MFVCRLCLHVISVCSCAYLYIRVDLCVSVMLFTQTAVSAQQSLSAAVNLWLIYLSSPLFLVDYNYSLCTYVFYDKKDGSYSMCSHSNTFSLSCTALKLVHVVWIIRVTGASYLSQQ